MTPNVHFTTGTGSAILSADGLYRYRLDRRWGPWPRPRVCWIMLNPSTADAYDDDATIRRCGAFSRRWGAGSMAVVNLYAWRATDPAALKRAADPVGPFNDEWIAHTARDATIVAAWGTKGGDRANIVLKRLAADGVTVHRLGAPTKDGHPRHPLYVKGDTDLEVHTA